MKPFKPAIRGLLIRTKGIAHWDPEENARDLSARLLAATTLLSATRLGDREGYWDAVAQTGRFSAMLGSAVS